MNENQFNAIQIEQKDQQFTAIYTQRTVSSLPKNDVLIRVQFSSLNYKDALSAAGNPGVTRQFPHTPGIDAVGQVEQSNDARFQKGDAVIATGFDLGMNTSGGLSELICVPGDWLVPLPEQLSPQEAMIFGTAGVTAALSVEKIVSHGSLSAAYKDSDSASPGRASLSIAVTGATGGVGSLAIAILSHLGYKVSAISGKKDAEPFLRELGADEVIDRTAFMEKSERPLLKPRFAAVLDTVGGDFLEQALKLTQYGGCVSCCGMAAKADFKSTVFPFILNGITLYGIDSVQWPIGQRPALWQKLASDWKPHNLSTLAHNIELPTVPEYFARFLNESIMGRYVVRVQS